MIPQNTDTLANRATPARRRQNRPSNTRSPTVKTYASENDMLNEPLFPIDLANGSPLGTPQKSASNSPVPHSYPVTGRPKTRNNGQNKPRLKPSHAPSSPGPTRPGRKTPPNTTAAKSASSTAFAGATFHASPAPSSLPIPSFLAKAMDSPRVKDTGRTSEEPSPPVTDSEAPTPQPKFAAKEVAREESPLDLFFRADRAEKERARRASSANVLSAAPGPFSPPEIQAQPSPEIRTAPRGPTTILRRRAPVQRNSTTGGISATELDGTPCRVIGPAFSTPYSERIRAARSSEKQFVRTPLSAHQQPPQYQPAQQRPSPTDNTAALKQLLFAKLPAQTQPVGPSPPPATQNSVPMPPSLQRLFSAPNGPRSQQQHSAQQHFHTQMEGGQSYFPTQPADSRTYSQPEQGNDNGINQVQDIRQMEDNLRRMLKLDAGGGGAPLSS